MTWKTIRKPDPFDVALLGLILAFSVGVVYYLQLRAMRDSVTQQVHAIRIDQRAWENVRSVTPESGVVFKEQEKLSVPLQISNTGKTPARKVQLCLFSEYLPVTQAPSVPPRGRYALEFDFGMMMPNNQPITLSVSPTEPGSTTQPGKPGVPMVITPDVKKALDGGTGYVATYGFLIYEDFFHKQHRLQFCFLLGSDAIHWNDSSAPCMNYNQIDEEEE